MNLPPNPQLDKIRLLAMDIDGVLTDGGVYMFEDGTEFRRFNIKDGLGLKRVMKAGIQVLWLSAGECEAARHRGKNLGITEIYLGVADKAKLLVQRCQALGIKPNQVAYIGDDLTDLAVMGLVGAACAPADAAPEVRGAAMIVTEAPGGGGAVREICDRLLAVRN